MYLKRLTSRRDMDTVKIYHRIFSPIKLAANCYIRRYLRISCPPYTEQSIYLREKQPGITAGRALTHTAILPCDAAEDRNVRLPYEWRR